MTNIVVWYRDVLDRVKKHTIKTDARSLMYDDPYVEPVEVRAIAKRGLVIGRTDGDLLTRSGTFIPPHQILEIDFADDCEL